MTYGTPIAAQLPAVQDPILSPGPTFATQYNAVIQEVMTRIEAKVGLTAIALGADLAVKNQRVTSLASVAMRDQVAALDRSKYARSLYALDGDWYTNDGRGRTIRITKDGLVDASAAAGISGSGYGSSGREIAWVTGPPALYRLKAAVGSDAYAGVRVDGVRMNDGSGHYMSLRMAAGGSANYDIQWLAALPGAGGVAGIYGTRSGTTVALSSQKTPGHQGNVSFVIPARAGIGSITPPAGDEVVTIVGGQWFIPFPVHVGQRIVDVAIRGAFTGGDAIELIEIDYNDSSNPRYTVVASIVVASSSEQTYVVTPSSPYAAVDGKFYGVHMVGSGLVSRARATLEWA